MKSYLLCTLLWFTMAVAHGQGGSVVSELPPGRYTALLKTGSAKWDRGDILLLNNSQYRISSEEEAGEYRISITAQRIFFTSGPLRGAFARLVLHHAKPAIELPLAENSHQRLASADVIAVLRQ